ncbi:NAD(P)H-hydrate dehydratase [Pontixanthobacter aestiaquae]|uniref:ADP-dependent (S)-NAD(P)H-hydrate dehydratase n=1 Tax=Pontixanthobacter aestiaquae TaxID=1509367 RepID=A0A844ZA43_9SPHN|nr:NAD(P)H-hydrate dehydratase [Pontixanthobacter aestiaquae]MDN3645268.1 NAD(P)H-hydrate dehydratase [Pontixanthobacter aestiaquae]MXO83730.1 NAD(P)H-hydrate dehydratase [Pontixanthobacter aestiaquae]
MTRPSDPILTAAQMAAAEQALIGAGSSVDELMHIAGKGAAEWVWRIAAGRPVTVLCGPGNNGGDGYVIAELLRVRAMTVNVVAPMAPKAPAAQNARRAFKGAVVTSGKGISGSVLVDCLFGSGLSRPLSAELLLLLRDLAERHPCGVAVDLPSGIASDSGEILNESLPENALTLALGAWKYAHWMMPASATMGERRLVPIGVAAPPDAAERIRKPALIAPQPDAHKYTRGLCAVIGGDMPGAAILSCTAAMRAGAGYVKLLSERPDVTVPADLVVDQRTLDMALDDKRVGSVLIGPGLGRDDNAEASLLTALAWTRTAVLDADAIVLLKPDMLRGDGTYIATPHEGELEQLCRSFAVLASGKREKAQALATASGMVIVAKGPDTIIAAPDGRMALAGPASSWLSTAGTGDVLAGIAASRLATRADPFEAACQAVWLHSEAARLAGPAFTATELAGKVADAYAACL